MQLISTFVRYLSLLRCVEILSSNPVHKRTKGLDQLLTKQNPLYLRPNGQTQELKFELNEVKDFLPFFQVELNNTSKEVVVHRMSDGQLLLTVDGRTHTTYMHETNDAYRVVVGNQVWSLTKIFQYFFLVQRIFDFRSGLSTINNSFTKMPNRDKYLARILTLS